MCSCFALGSGSLFGPLRRGNPKVLEHGARKEPHMFFTVAYLATFTWLSKTCPGGHCILQNLYVRRFWPSQTLGIRGN